MREIGPRIKFHMIMTDFIFSSGIHRYILELIFNLFAVVVLASNKIAYILNGTLTKAILRKGGN